MEASPKDQQRAAHMVSELNDLIPTECPIVKQVRSDYADWYYDLPEGYIRYYKGSIAKLYEQRLVAQRAYGAIPSNSVVRHCNHDRADNAASNLKIVSRAEHAIETFGHLPAEERVCANGECGKHFKVTQQRVDRSLTGDLYCSRQCCQYAQRKVRQRPEKAELEQLMIDVNHWTALGEMFGVSDNAVRKWAKHYGLDLSICDGRRKAINRLV